MVTSDSALDVPRGNFRGFTTYFRHDLTAGFLVFLIALPLCLGISLACGYPPIAGIFTAIIGSILSTFISNSELSIKGPAAGLIVIAIGCVNDFGGDGAVGGFTDVDLTAYKAALAVGVAAAVLQILFGIFRGGILGDFFPVSAVHGMLAAIGVMIILKQLPVALGVTAKGEPFELLREMPQFVLQANPAIAAIGITSLLIMFLWPSVGRRVGFFRIVPSPMIVLLVAVTLGMVFDLLHEHSYVLQGHTYQLGEQYLVTMPDRVFGMFDELTAPDFSALWQPKAWKWVFMFFIIGTLESILSAKAVDMIDPWKRKTSLDRDVLAIGVGNLCSALVGGLPMISEIVRSRANIDNGARTRFGGMWHGVFLLACVALIPMLLHRVPLAALAAMLVYTGYRLAHPTEFVNVYRIGREQLVIFVTTLVAVLATDLLVGIGIGILVKVVIHLMNGVALKSLFKPFLEVEQQDEQTSLIRAHQSAVFSNWIPFRRQLEDIGLVQRQNIVLDLSNTKLVDHSVMEKLHEMQMDFAQQGLTLSIIGLEGHVAVGHHALAARVGRLARLRRLTLVADRELEDSLVDAMLKLGASGYTASACHGSGRHSTRNGNLQANRAQVRLEVIVVPEVAERILAYLRQEVLPLERVIVCAETVEVLRRDHFEAPVTSATRQMTAN